MKVLIFNHAFFYISETFIYQQVKGMPADIEMEMLGFDFPNGNIFPLTNRKVRIKRSENIVDRIFSSLIKRFRPSRSGLSFFTKNKLKKILKDSNPDLIHAHFGFNALLIYPVAKALNIPLLVTFHGLDASPHYLNNKKYKRDIDKLISYASGIIIVSPHMKETLELSSWKEKVHLISCGVNTDEFNSEPRAQGEVINILHSGRLVSKKGVPDLIRVFIELNKKYPHTRLHIIGEGPDLELSTQLATDAHAGAIVFYGAKPHSEVKKIMSDSDIFVLNSRTSDSGDMEGLPVSLLEAMSMRIPVVSTRHAGIPYLITNEINGLLADEKNNRQLSDALEKVIVNKDLRKKFGEAARKTVSESFTSQEINRRISEVYRQIAEVRRKAVSP